MWWWCKQWVGHLTQMNMWSCLVFIKSVVNPYEIFNFFFFLINTCTSALYLFHLIQCFILNDSDQWVPCRHWRTTRMYTCLKFATLPKCVFPSLFTLFILCLKEFPDGWVQVKLFYLILFVSAHSQWPSSYLNWYETYWTVEQNIVAEFVFES